MTQPGIDPDKHYSVLFGGGDSTIRIRIACGSKGDVSVSQANGVFVQELKEEVVNVTGGPLLVDCSKHGQYLGFLQLLPTGVEAKTGGQEVSMPLLLIPLPGVEYLLPIDQGRRLAQGL